MLTLALEEEEGGLGEWGEGWKANNIFQSVECKCHGYSHADNTCRMLIALSIMQ